jgi:hypothetical protein
MVCKASKPYVSFPQSLGCECARFIYTLALPPNRLDTLLGWVSQTGI